MPADGQKIPRFVGRALMANPHAGPNLSHHLGSRHPEHIRRWAQAGLAARRAMPKCEAVAKTTRTQCSDIPVAGRRFCYRHICGADAGAVDLALEQRNAEILEKGSIPIIEERARRSMASIARRRMHRSWKIDPRTQGSTLDLDERTEVAVANWLWDQFHIDMDMPLPGADREATPRCRDRLRWAAYRVLRRGKNASDEFIAAARMRVAAALRDDYRFWEKWERS